MKIQWLLIIVAALAIEVALFAILVPVQMLFGAQASLVLVLIGVAVVTFLLTTAFARRIRERLVLHGFLIGLLATLIYISLLVSQGVVGTAIEMYGLLLFVAGNGLRIVAAMMGGVVERKRRSAHFSPIR